MSEIKSLTYVLLYSRLKFREAITNSLGLNYFLSETAEISKSELNNRPGNFPVSCTEVK